VNIICNYSSNCELYNEPSTQHNKSSTGYRLPTTDKRNIPLLQYPCQWDVVTRETDVTKEKLLINRANVYRRFHKWEVLPVAVGTFNENSQICLYQLLAHSNRLSQNHWVGITTSCCTWPAHVFDQIFSQTQIHWVPIVAGSPHTFNKVFPPQKIIHSYQLLAHSTGVVG
jgi:hypothetical protein